MEMLSGFAVDVASSLPHAVTVGYCSYMHPFLLSTFCLESGRAALGDGLPALSPRLFSVWGVPISSVTSVESREGAMAVALPAFGSVCGRGHLWLPCWASEPPSSLSAGCRVTLSKFTWPLLGFSFVICKMGLVILIIALGLPWWLNWERIRLQCRRPGFKPWVGKIPWRRERLPTPVCWPGEFHGLYSLWGCKELDMTK